LGGPRPTFFYLHDAHAAVGSILENYTNKVEKLIVPVLEDMGMALVRVRISEINDPMLQIMIEHTDDRTVSVEDCAKASRSISVILDAEDPIKQPYTLEVSSPGIDRPLVHPRDFARFVGFEAKVDLRTAVLGRKHYRGRLLGIVNDAIRLSTETGEAELPLNEIEKAKLVLTDDLLTANMTMATEHEG
jgi:ribosome maturation factor RimP